MPPVATPHPHPHTHARAVGTARAALEEMRAELLHERHVLKRALVPRRGGRGSDAVRSLWDPAARPPSSSSSTTTSTTSYGPPRRTDEARMMRAQRRMQPALHPPPPPPRPPTADDEMVRPCSLPPAPCSLLPAPCSQPPSSVTMKRELRLRRRERGRLLASPRPLHWIHQAGRLANSEQPLVRHLAATM
jgi:hypothetical protein